MINKLIKKQLDNVQVANLSNFDESTNTYFIKKYEEFRFEIDKCYLVELDDILLLSDGLPVLVSNWNKGTVPKHKYLKISVDIFMTKMIHVIATGYDMSTKQDVNYMWSGWLPAERLRVISAI